MPYAFNVLDKNRNALYSRHTLNIFIDIQGAVVIFVPKNKYSSKFMIVGDSCILNDQINTSLTNESETTEN